MPYSTAGIEIVCPLREVGVTYPAVNYLLAGQSIQYPLAGVEREYP